MHLKTGEKHYQAIIDQLNEDGLKKNGVSENRIASLTEQVETLSREIGALKEDIKNKTEDFEKQLASAIEEAQVEAAKKATELEGHLRQQISELSDALQNERNSSEKRGDQAGQELESYKEQIRQHALTISAMEERIGKLTKKNKDYKEEIDKLGKEVNEWKSKRPVSPIQRKKPSVVESSGLEEVLKRENAELRAQVVELQQTVSTLKRDLSGAAARLSDMTGELSESQKQEMERCRQLAERKAAELETTREQLAKLSAIVDKLKAESESLKNENRGLKKDTEKLGRDCGEREKIVQDLRDQLCAAQEKMRMQVEKIEDEGKSRQDLVQMGMQCRGERHEQIIVRQREALAELRTRIRQLEQNKLPSRCFVFNFTFFLNNLF